MGVFVLGHRDREEGGEDGRAGLGDWVAVCKFAADRTAVKGVGLLARVADACECGSGGHGEGAGDVGVRYGGSTSATYLEVWTALRGDRLIHYASVARLLK